jgi:hypothetical protein
MERVSISRDIILAGTPKQSKSSNNKAVLGKTYVINRQNGD